MAACLLFLCMLIGPHYTVCTMLDFILNCNSLNKTNYCKPIFNYTDKLKILSFFPTSVFLVFFLMYSPH